MIAITYERNLRLCITYSLRAGKLRSVPLLIPVFFELQHGRESLCTGDTLGFSIFSMDGKADFNLIHSASNTSFRKALLAALEAVQDSLYFACTLTEWALMFDSPASKACALQTTRTDGDSVHSLALAYAELELQDHATCNEHQLLEILPDYDKEIRAFNQQLTPCRLEQNSLLVKLNIERLLQLLRSRRLSIRHCAPLYSVDALFSWLLQTIPLKSCRLVRRIFAWMSWTNKPLRIDELGAALKLGWEVPPASETPVLPDTGIMRNLQVSITELCRGLVVIGSDETVGFVDQSVKNHLISEHFRTDMDFYPMNYQESQELLALSCLQCLKRKAESPNSMTQDRVIPTEIHTSPGNNRFALYAEEHWTQHCRSSEASSYYVVGAIQEYLQCSLTNQNNLGWKIGEHCSMAETLDLRNAILRECAHHGFAVLGTMYVEMGADVDEIDEASGLSSVALALNNQHWDMATILLEKGASLDTSVNGEGASILHQAAAQSRCDIIEYLSRYAPASARWRPSFMNVERKQY